MHRPTPWTVEAQEGGFTVRDATGMAMLYVHARVDDWGAQISNVLRWEEARELAEAITRLPGYLSHK